MKILVIGDIVGKPGRRAIKELLPPIKEEENIGVTIANAENAAGGSGVTPPIARELFDYGIDALTSGDHIWKKKEVIEFISRESRLLRPANYPAGVPGTGATVIEAPDGTKIGVINLLGRVFMQPVECPFRAAKEAVKRLRQTTSLIVVDIHAEATSEKLALCYYLDGEVSAVLGTHTHVQTADERVTPAGTACITDLGMTGPFKSILGRKEEQIVERFILQMPVRFEMAEDDIMLCGAIIDIDSKTGRAISIKRIQRKL